jgi:manganese/zinc/iron transport system substrate-binding protein
VFVESSVPRKSLEAVIDGARARGHHVVIGGELYSDSGGPAGTYEGTYVGMMDHNITLITRALGGSAPAAGFRGSLSGHGYHSGQDPRGELP